MLSTDIKFYLSGGAANADPALSVGGAISTTEVSATALNNVWSDIASDDMSDGFLDYRCIYVKNVSAETLVDARVWISSNSRSFDTTFALGLDRAGMNASAQVVTSPPGLIGTGAPVDVVFSQAGTARVGLRLGDLGPNDYYPLWMRRKVDDDAVILVDLEGNDPVTISVTGIPT